jgi:hypothetical protein
MMKTLVGLSLGLSLLAHASRAEASGNVSLTTLPVGDSLTAPAQSQAPNRLAPGERAPNFYISAPQPESSFLSASKAKADQMMGKGNFVEEDPQETGCFYEVDRAFRQDGGNEPRKWTLSAQETVYMSTGDREIRPVKFERIEIQGDKAMLHQVTAWVDAVTRSARLIAKKDVPLAKIKSAFGVTVWGGKGTSEVHYAITADDNGSGRQIMLEDSTGQLMHAQCHASITMPMGKGATDSVTGYLNAVVGAPIEGKAKNNPFGGQFEPARMRTLAVNMSASQLSADPEPQTSVSMAWTGTEMTTQVKANLLKK